MKNKRLNMIDCEIRQTVFLLFSILILSIALNGCSGKEAAIEKQSSNDNQQIKQISTNIKQINKEPVEPILKKPQVENSNTEDTVLVSRTMISGCLKDDNPQVTYAKTRLAGDIIPEKYLVIAGKRKVSITQHFNHACCLKGQVSIKRNKNIITVTTTMLGNPCRCKCSSKTTTSISLDSGEYTVRFIHITNSKEREVHIGKVTI